jgi:hypothetical protein
VLVFLTTDFDVLSREIVNEALFEGEVANLDIVNEGFDTPQRWGWLTAINICVRRRWLVALLESAHLESCDGVALGSQNPK